MKNPLHVITFLILTIISLVAIKNNYLTGSNFVDNHSIMNHRYDEFFGKLNLVMSELDKINLNIMYPPRRRKGFYEP